MKLETTALDHALEGLHATDAEYGNGLASHGPMAAEALETLGLSERIEPFLAGYTKRLRPAAPADAIPWERWTDALGDEDARHALVHTFDRALRERPFAEVLQEVLPVLAPGLAGAAFHGVIRAGHGVRGVQRIDNVVRRTELAHGLAYWAARWIALPGELGSEPEAGVGVAPLLESVPRRAQPKLEGLIADRLLAVAQLDGFSQALASFDAEAMSPEATIDAVVAAAAQGYLRAPDGRRRFVFLHVITGSAATRRMLSYVDDQGARALANALVHGAGAVWATHADPQRDEPEAVEVLDRATLLERVAVTKDDHAIKIVDAALSEHARGGPDALLAVASLAV